MSSIPYSESWLPLSPWCPFKKILMSLLFFCVWCLISMYVCVVYTQWNGGFPEAGVRNSSYLPRMPEPNLCPLEEQPVHLASKHPLLCFLSELN